nr:unnamed protein product [Digitaria exilis]
MGFMLRVRLASFFAGAAAAAAGGGYFLYKDYKLAHDSMALKDYKLAHDSMALKVKGLQDSTDARYKALEKRLAALEGSQTKATPRRLRRQKSEILRAQYIDVRELRFQEIIPLEVGYMIGTEDTYPVANLQLTLLLWQLKKELGKGCAFDGWVEGAISFPPTYKYEFNSEKYVSDATKSGRRTPAWCDRILSYGKGTRVLSYKRAELTFSDHRPVTAIYMADVEVFVHRKFQRALTFTNTQVDDNLLLEKEAFLGLLNHETSNLLAQVPSKVIQCQILESA